MNELGGGGIITAKKQYSCTWCQAPIPNGEKHYQFKGKWDGEWQNWRMHAECSTAHDDETQNGEIHDHPHERGRTCAQTQVARWRKAQEIGEIIKSAIDGKHLKNDRAFEDLGLEILGILEDHAQEDLKRTADVRKAALKEIEA